MMDRLVNANALLRNPVFIQVMEKLWSHIESQQLNCDPTDAKKCQMLIVSKQQLGMLERNIHRIIDNAKAEIQLAREKEERKLDPKIEWGKR